MSSSTLPNVDFRAMSAADRLKLIGDIWDTLDKDFESIPLTEAQRQKLDRAVEQHRRNPSAGSPWPEVEARILAKLFADRAKP